jgi:acyl-CoA thioesterase-1
MRLRASNGKTGDRMRWLILPMLAALAFLSACGENIGPSPLAAETQTQAGASDAVTETAPVIVMLGDSLTAGFQLPAGNALPAVLQRLFDERDIPAKFVNAGVSGDTTADGLNRYDWSVKGSGADMLVIALGANDFLSEMAPEVPKRNLAAILERARADNLPAVLVGVAIPGEREDEREAAYAAIYPELAREYGVPYFADMLGAVSGRPELLQQDGVHPTEEGVEAMASGIADFLAPLVGDLDLT